MQNTQSDKALVSKIHEELLIRKQPNLKMSKDRNRPLLNEDIQMAGKHMKRRSYLYVIRELQIKTRDHHPHIRMARIPKLTTPNAEM